MKCLNSELSTTSSACWYGESHRKETEPIYLSLRTSASKLLLRLMRHNQALSLEDSQLLAKAVLPIVSRYVNAGRGFVVLKLPWDDGLSVNSLIAATVGIAESVGRLIEQDKAGTRIVHVRDLGRKMEEGARYHESNASGGLHTDGPQLDDPPDLLFMACFNRARQGGDSLLASAITIHNHLLQANPSLLKVLHANFCFDRRGFCEGNEPTFERPIFRCSSDGLHFRYLYEYILEGHKKVNVPLSRKQHDAVSTLQDLLGSDKFVRNVAVNAGEVLVVNNRRVCHGRTVFHDEPGEGPARHMVRIWAKIR